MDNQEVAKDRDRRHTIPYSSLGVKRINER